MKTSYGVCCTRYNDILNNYEILLVNKRLSYSFIEFINGNYTLKNVRNLFNTMTVEEKNIILSIRYEFIYYYAYLSLEKDIPINRYQIYQINKKYYEKTFTKKILEELISGTNSIETIWEFPKGRAHFNESPISAAQREFSEETGINNINFYEDEPPDVCVMDKIYKYVLYHANYEGSTHFSYKYNTEIASVKWINFNNARKILKSVELKKILKNCMKIAKKYNK